jgi:hypothetical protein
MGSNDSAPFCSCNGRANLIQYTTSLTALTVYMSLESDEVGGSDIRSGLLVMSWGEGGSGGSIEDMSGALFGLHLSLLTL